MWVRIGVTLGFPTSMCIILLAALMGWIPSPITAMLQAQREQIEVLRIHEREGAISRREIAASTDYQNILLRTLCRNLVAKYDLTQCEPRYRGYDENK